MDSSVSRCSGPSTRVRPARRGSRGLLEQMRFLGAGRVARPAGNLRAVTHRLSTIDAKWCTYTKKKNSLGFFQSPLTEVNEPDVAHGLQRVPVLGPEHARSYLQDFGNQRLCLDIARCLGLGHLQPTFPI